ncbi:sodium:dicarboxylate symporter family protein [Sarocladium implicatum]|nr:sodium:dicarboxylate symporter family protein [Sarocladium implicatum]
MADTKEVTPDTGAYTAPPTKDSKDVYGSADPVSASSTQEPAPMYPEEEVEREKRPWWSGFFIMGHVLQIITAAVLAIALGIGISAAVDVPESARVIIGIPGDLWLRCLKAIVIPLIVCAMILAVQRLRAMQGEGGKLLARWTIGFYVITTIFSIIMSVIMTALIWGPQFNEVGEESLATTAEQDAEFPDPSERPWYRVVETLFQSFIPANVVQALADNELLSILITAVVLGYLIRDADSVFLKLVAEIENMVTRVVAFLIKLAPIGVFFLILPNLFRLNIAEIGYNLGMLIAGTLATMGVHCFIVLPALFFGFTRLNPYSYWLKISPAWITAWGCASSAATLPVTLRVARERGIPQTIYKFTCPLGCLINMDGTAIYFPMAVVFLAETQGITLGPTQYVLMVLLATLSAIGTTPIPSSSLVLTLMIANSIDVPLTGMYAVIVAIDWFLDRFRTALNVSGDLFASRIIEKMTGITDEDVDEQALNPAIRSAV